MSSLFNIPSIPFVGVFTSKSDSGLDYSELLGSKVFYQENQPLNSESSYSDIWIDSDNQDMYRFQNALDDGTDGGPYVNSWYLVI